MPGTLIMRQPWLSACIMVTLFPMATGGTQHYMSSGICKRTSFWKTGESSLFLLLPLRLARSLGHDLRKKRIVGGSACIALPSALALPPQVLSRSPPLPPILPLPQFISEKVSMLSPSLPSFSARRRKGGKSDFSTGGVGGGKDRECDLSPPLRNPRKIRGGSSAHTLPLYGRESEGPPGGSFSSGRFLCPHSPPPLFLSSLAAQSRGGIWVGKRREGEGGGESWLRVSCRHSPPH